MLTVNQHKLNNGLTVIHCQTQNHAEFEISMHIKTGARDENETNSGISHFLEHMMFRGSRYYPNSIMLARALEKFGGEINAITGIEHTTYWMKGDTEQCLEAIPCFAEFFLYPNFADLETERGVILQELASDYNEQGDCIDVEHLAMKTIFQNHSLSNPILGNYETVKKISISDLKEKRKNEYLPNQCILTIYSSQCFESILKIVEKSFDVEWPHIEAKTKKVSCKQNSISYKHNPSKKSKNFLSLQNNADNQYAMKIIFPIGGGLSANTIHTVFLQRILDDGICTRLPGNIREQHGLVYDISCDTQFFYEIGVLGVDVTVSDDRFSELLTKMAFEIRNILSEKPSDEEMNHIRYRYLFDLKKVAQNPSRFLSRHANAIFMDSNFSLQEEAEIVRNIDAHTVHQTAYSAFVQNYRGLALIGPKAKKQRNQVEKFLKIFEH